MQLPKERKPYSLWINYGSEGWSPFEFADTPEELLEIARQDSLCGEWIIMKEMHFVAVKEVKE